MQITFTIIAFYLFIFFSAFALPLASCTMRPALHHGGWCFPFFGSLLFTVDHIRHLASVSFIVIIYYNCNQSGTLSQKVASAAGSWFDLELVFLSVCCFSCSLQLLRFPPSSKNTSVLGLATLNCLQGLNLAQVHGSCNQIGVPSRMYSRSTLSIPGIGSASTSSLIGINFL